MFELSRLHHARPPAEPGPQRHEPVTPRQCARLAALRRLFALPVALLRRLAGRRGGDAPEPRPARRRVHTARLTP